MLRAISACLVSRLMPFQTLAPFRIIHCRQVTPKRSAARSNAHPMGFGGRVSLVCPEISQSSWSWSSLRAYIAWCMPLTRACATSRVQPFLSIFWAFTSMAAGHLNSAVGIHSYFPSCWEVGLVLMKVNARVVGSGCPGSSFPIPFTEKVLQNVSLMTAAFASSSVSPSLLKLVIVLFSYSIIHSCIGWPLR